ncbi:MAG TPA: DUF402 domain-containing protein [Thermomicrobiales bacterium]|nr:DUF402 domain-containing protein [Thermomicrobiales bacterium]
MTGRAILEVKETLAGEHQEFACSLLAAAPGEAVILYEMHRAGRVADLDLPAGTLSLGYFWEDRPYNAYHWLTPAGRTLALYCNIADRTRITPAAIAWRDLAVDVLATPDGRAQVLDEDELPPDLDPALRAAIAAARDDLLAALPALLPAIERCTAALLAGRGRCVDRLP